MTAKEKAKELVEAMAFSCRECDYEAKAKQSALIAVDEILDVITSIYDYDFEKLNPYWEEVKQEIENL
jgi:hypothetical protein